MKLTPTQADALGLIIRRPNIPARAIHGGTLEALERRNLIEVYRDKTPKYGIPVTRCRATPAGRALILQPPLPPGP